MLSIDENILENNSLRELKIVSVKFNVSSIVLPIYFKLVKFGKEIELSQYKE